MPSPSWQDENEHNGFFKLFTSLDRKSVHDSKKERFEFSLCPDEHSNEQGFFEAHK